ncbi:MAG: hypothetical protein EBT09_02630 [Actinobacteria bacterium]|nr:hypothetical protein [Actinomycetota bacterium]
MKLQEKQKNPSGASNHHDGGRIILLKPGMLLCKRTKYRNPGARGRALLPANLTERATLDGNQRTP